LGLAKVRRVANEPELGSAAASPDLEALRSILINRMHVLRAYMQRVTLPVLGRECEERGDISCSVVPMVGRWLTWHPRLLDEAERERLGELTHQLPSFGLVLRFRNELKNLWEGAHTSNERLLEDFRQWCRRADESGNQYLREFVAYLRSFQPTATPA
jgi:hypothetical protein